MSKKKQPAVAVGKPNPWPMLSEYRDGSGVFRARPITWSPFLHLSANPYSMGLISAYCLNVGNWMGMLSGGMVNPSLTFQPPAKLRDIFADAYKLARKPGKFIAWANVPGVTEGVHEWVECDLKSFTSPCRFARNGNKGLDEWEAWFGAQAPVFESMHTALTECGVPEFPRVAYNLDTAANMTAAELHRTAAALGEKDRMGLAV